MKGNWSTRKLLMAAMCAALCVVLPIAFHLVANAGTVFLPMHIPVLLCGLICGWPYGLLCGLIGPLLSSVCTGMPPVGYLPAMTLELAVYGLVTGLMMQRIRTGKLYADLYLSLGTAMLCGRVLSGVAKALLFAPGKTTLAAWAVGSFVTALPGIVIQLALIPTLVVALEKAGLLPGRYPCAERTKQKEENPKGTRSFSPDAWQSDVTRFFDTLAPSWDDEMERSERRIQTILDTADIREGVSVLDAGCGTGVLIADYLARGAKRVLAVDISGEMCRRAEEKFKGEDRVAVVCGDASRLADTDHFDRIVVYNAFPHFEDPERLFQCASSCLHEGGRFTVAHGMSREAVLKHHAGCAAHVSHALPDAQTLAQQMQPWFIVDAIVSNEEVYIVSGTKK